MSLIPPVARRSRDARKTTTTTTTTITTTTILHRAIELFIFASVPFGMRDFYSDEISLYETSPSRSTKCCLYFANFLISSLRPFCIDARRMTYSDELRRDVSTNAGVVDIS